MLRLLQKFSGLLLLLISVHVYSRQITDTTITVYFKTGKYILPQREEQKLTGFFMQKSKATMIRIAGHTDTVGSESANMTLSRKRSESVAAWIKKNVGTENIRLEYFGKTQIISPDHNDLNRRVEIIIQFPGIVNEAKKNRDTVLVRTIELDKLYFEPDKAILESFSFDYLNSIVPVLKSYRNARFEIRGHVNYETTRNDSGELKKMNELSVDRAKVIYEMLVERGIPANKMSYQGMGNTQMVFPHPVNDDEKRKNMRVEILVFSNQ